VLRFDDFMVLVAWRYAYKHACYFGGICRCFYKHFFVLRFDVFMVLVAFCFVFNLKSNMDPQIKRLWVQSQELEYESAAL